LHNNHCPPRTVDSFLVPLVEVSFGGPRMESRIIQAGRNEVAQTLAGTAQTHSTDVCFVRGVVEDKRPKFRQRQRLLVPAYGFMNYPGKPTFFNGQPDAWNTRVKNLNLLFRLYNRLARPGMIGRDISGCG
jgi:hypothetical protein